MSKCHRQRIPTVTDSSRLSLTMQKSYSMMANLQNASKQQSRIYSEYCDRLPLISICPQLGCTTETDLMTKRSQSSSLIPHQELYSHRQRPRQLGRSRYLETYCRASTHYLPYYITAEARCKLSQGTGGLAPRAGSTHPVQIRRPVRRIRDGRQRCCRG